MRLLLLMVVSFISIESRSSIVKDDPAPGRSGPPKFEDVFPFESHESYRPTIRINNENQTLENKSSALNNREAFNTVISRENVEEFDRNSNQTASERLSILERFTSENIEYSEESASADAEASSDFVPCDLRSLSSRVSSYVKLGTKVIAEEFNFSNEQKNYYSNSAQNKFIFDVTHDVFETSSSEGGLLEGIIYKIELVTSPNVDVIDFLLETTVNTGEKIGQFIESNQKEQSGADNSIEYFFRGKAKASASSNLTRNYSQNVAKDQLFEKANDCEINTIYHKFNESKSNQQEEKFSISWSYKNLMNKPRGNSITFRLLYRRRNEQEIFEKNLTFNLLRECSLVLKVDSNWFGSSLVPDYAKSCTFRFAAPNNQLNAQQQGLLIKIVRLNVPCSSGGYLQFNGTITMCGKLEEFPENRRTLYFSSFPKTSFSVNNYPKFKFFYKLVDNCYNVTFLEHNNSFAIEPTDAPIKCHFNIHLPFGNKIKLQLRLDGDGGKRAAIDETIKRNMEGKLNYNDLKLDDFTLPTESALSHEHQSCDDFFVEIVNRLNEKWEQCVSLSLANSLYTLTSSDNVLLIRLTKRAKTGSFESSMERKITLEYTAEPIETIVSQCAFGWILVGQFCLSTFNQPLSWQDAENYCNVMGGHLASIQNENEQLLIDTMLLNSPYFNEKMPFWIGATDKHFEGDFRWTDGLPFSYLNWFPGWPSTNYNKQPNDDGFSEQDCVEIRRNFHQAATSNSILTDSFMWNDRDCNSMNFFICERPLTDDSVSIYESEDCNKTIHLTQDKMRTVLTSPGFPRVYSDNLNCVTFLIAPNGFRILIEFEEFVLEHEPQCLYDYLEIFELTTNQFQAKDGTFRHSHGSARKAKKSILSDFGKNNSSDHYRFESRSSMKSHHSKVVLQPSNVTYNVFAPAPRQSSQIPRKICGDWSSKLKLLRYRTHGNMIGIHFSSDYSHHFSGFKARISLEKDNLEIRAASECIDEHLKLFNDSCYLVVSFPEVEWVVAQKICHSMGAQLSSVSTIEEQRFIISTVKASQDYNPNSFYWLGAEYSKSGQLMEWTDGTKTAYTGWFSGEEKIARAQTDDFCLGLQWKVSTGSMNPSNFYWNYQKCSHTGGYVCKKSRNDNVLVQNQTITGVEGRLTSPNYPNPYSPNMNYWIRIIAPEKFRLIVQFQKLDIEQQHECLYDYVSIQDVEFYKEFQSKASDEVLSKLERDLSDYQNDAEDDEKKIHLLRKRSKNDLISSNNTSQSFQPYHRLCGSYDGDMSRFDFVSTSNEIYFNFFTDHSISGEGFSAMWRSIDISACPGQTFTARDGTLTSPNFPHFLLHNLNCTYTVQAPKGRRVWIEFESFNILQGAELSIDLGEGDPFQPFHDAENIADGAFLSSSDKVKILLRTGSNPRGKGFKLAFRTIFQNVQSRTMSLTNASLGNLYHLNHPLKMPKPVNYTQHLSVPLGHVFSIELHGVKFGEQSCDDGESVEVIDKYADKNGTYWLLCRANKQMEQHRDPIFITSYLNTIHIRQRSSDSRLGILNATVRVQPDINYKLKLLSTSDEWVESCQPNPCQHEGKCVDSKSMQICQCKGHFTGRFCGLNMCELDPCVFGQCELTNSSFKCICQTGYLGLTCDQRQKPCNDNPCEGRGECIEKNGGYTCRCFAWFEGPKCEKRMKVPYRPLSERMLQEPFWLGLITVFVVLAVIGLVWCAKRHFPEKIEKLLQEEADRNRPAHLRHHHHISLREQLQVAGAANNPLMHSGSSQAIVTTPGTQKSIFGRLGIRKPSLLSLSSPQPPQGSTARTFSLDDLLMPLPRRSPSPRKKRNNSTPSRKDAAEKKKILQQLISPNANSKVTLGELIQLSENDDAAHNNLASHSSENNFKETAFIERPPSTNAVGQQPRKLMRQVSSDPKLEKKVTFARLLSKMSAEINVGSDVDGNNHSSALSLPTDVQLRANSVPQSPCTNDIRSPHSTSSNQGSDSLSSSELALHEFNLKNNSRKNRPKVSSADSILAMFRNFASSNVGLNLPASLIFSPSSSTPTASSPQDDMGDDESSTSSVPTPVSFSSGAPDSPVFYRQSTIEVPVMDAISAHKTTPAQNLLHPPTILLEIPGNITKCLSPIKEMPTPMPSPALTPIMPRPQRLTKSSNVRDFAFSDDDDKNHYLASNPKFTGDISSEMKMRDSDNDSIAVYTTLCESSDNSSRKSKFVSVPTISIDINPPTPDERAEKRSPQRPKDLIIPELVVQTPSPTKERYPVTIIPGSPPPQRARASIGETSSLFPDKQQQKRLLMQFDKPGSLDFPFVPPMITITANMSEVESDTEFLSPVTSKALLLPIKLIPNTSGMTYLSPFSMCTRGDRAPSEGNLSSSGYSSMASPGPSRCGSNSKLCANEMDSTVASLTPSSSHPRRFQSILKKPDENERNAGKDGNGYFRKRSDSETLSDETLLESNDEGIGTDHIDEKIEDGDIKSARDLEVFIGKELLETGKSLMSIDEQPMAQLQLPSIVIQSEFGFDKLSPVSSRSESPLSDRNIGMAKFSPQFFGKKDQQLPFTDSDGLYDFPSSDGKGGSGTTHIRKSLGKRKERRSSKTAILSASPSKSTASNEKLSDHLEIPAKGIQSTSSKHYASSSFVRKSPKRRSYRYTPSSSSSTESLTANSCAKEMPSIKLRDSLIENIEMKHSKNVPDESSLYGQASEKRSCGSQPIKKVSRMKAIGHQIRFLRRLDKALKEREKSKYISDVDEDSDFPDSTKASTPLLQSCSKDSNKTNQSRFSRQKKLATLMYSRMMQKTEITLAKLTRSSKLD